jgi:hypothetical protein
MKFVISFLFLILIVINSVLLLFQYQVYSTNLAEDEPSYLYEQEIEVKLKENKMIIKQHFANLPKEEAVILWPINSENRSCELNTSDGCDRLEEDLSVFVAGETKRQSISFEIPITEGLVDGKVFSGLFAKLDQGGVSYTTLHITDELKRGGMWVSGLPEVGTTSLDLIEYSLAYGTGAVTELFWQKDSVPLIYEDDYFTIYSVKDIPTEWKEQLGKLHIPGSEHVSVLLNNNKKINSSRIVTISAGDRSSLERELLHRNVKEVYGLGNDQTLLADIISSFLLNHPIGSGKATAMYEALNNYFTSEQLVEWNILLENQKNSQLNAERLDELLEEIFALKTSFFTHNVQAEVEYFPLLFEDSRTVYINELKQEKISVIFKDSQVLYDLEPLLSELGYTLVVSDEGLYIQNDKRAFRFPIQEPFYVLNKKRYDAISEPFEKIGSQFFVEETWMIRLFLVEIEKQEKQINITQAIF